MKVYSRGDTAYFSIIHEVYTLTTNTWAAGDPDATFPKITITDPGGTTKVDAASMTKRATGKFDYSYEIASDAVLGTWTGYIQVENGTYPDKEYFSFGVNT